MNPQCLLGVHIFLYSAIKYNSLISLLVYTNGIIYYTHEKNQLIRYYDIGCNTLIICYFITIKNYYDCYGFLGIFCFFLNLFTQTKYYDYIHILLVQFPLAYSMNNYYYLL